jgi:hypothetical protein
MTTKIQLRRDTSANWTSINPTLFSGEIGFETDTGKFKIGNGSSVWSALDYFLDSSDLSGYLTAASASTTYLTQASASTTYLTQASASSTYLTQASASTTYLTQASASSTYPTIGTLNSGLVSASAAAVAYLVDSAPGALDTLNELAAAINDDSSYATTVTNALAAKASLSGTETLTNKTLTSPIITGSGFDAWTSYTPVAKLGSTTLTSGSTTGSYIVIGKTVHVIINDSTYLTGSRAVEDVNVSLPFAVSGGTSYGSGYLFFQDGSGAYYYSTATVVGASGGSTVTFMRNDRQMVYSGSYSNSIYNFGTMNSSTFVKNCTITYQKA